MHLIGVFFCFVGLLLSSRLSSCARLNHGATCDCFITPTQTPSSFDELLQFITEEIASSTTMSSTPQPNVSAPEPRLLIVQPSSENVPTESNRFRRPPKHRFASTTTTQSPNGPLSIDDVFTFLESSQQKLKDYGWLPSNYQPFRSRLNDDDSNYLMKQDDATNNDPTTLFSLKRGFVSRNLLQAGRLMQMIDKFDCRCAGNVNSIVNAKKFVRFSISHL